MTHGDKTSQTLDLKPVVENELLTENKWRWFYHQMKEVTYLHGNIYVAGIDPSNIGFIEIANIYIGNGDNIIKIPDGLVTKSVREGNSYPFQDNDDIFDKDKNPIGNIYYPDSRLPIIALDFDSDYLENNKYIQQLATRTSFIRKQIGIYSIDGVNMLPIVPNIDSSRFVVVSFINKDGDIVELIKDRKSNSRVVIQKEVKELITEDGDLLIDEGERSFIV